MNKTTLLKKLNGINKDYKKIVKLAEFKQLKKDLKKIDEFTTNIEHNDDITTKTQKISINKNMLDNIKELANIICNDETNDVIKKATNNQLKKALSLAIFEQTSTTLKLAIKTNDTKLYNYVDATKVYATFKTFIENLKTQNKTMSICVDIVSGNLKFVDAEKMYNELLQKKQIEKQNAKLARANKKQIENEKATKKAK